MSNYPGGAEPLCGDDCQLPDIFDLSNYEDCLARNVLSGVANPGGVYLGYFVDYDNTLSAAEKQRLLLLGRSTSDSPIDYKIHLSPVGHSIKHTAAAVIDKCRESSDLRDALFQVKFWAVPVRQLKPDIPRVILYPRRSDKETVLTIVSEIAPVLGELGIKGSGISPRFNAHLGGFMWYLAQGSGYDKLMEPGYRQQFDPATNWAIETNSLPEFSELQAAAALSI
jgi:hypothetical protein